MNKLEEKLVEDGFEVCSKPYGAPGTLYIGKFSKQLPTLDIRITNTIGVTIGTNSCLVCFYSLAYKDRPFKVWAEQPMTLHTYNRIRKELETQGFGKSTKADGE